MNAYESRNSRKLNFAKTKQSRLYKSILRNILYSCNIYGYNIFVWHLVSLATFVSLARTNYNDN